MKKLLIILVLFLTGCSNYHELNNLGVISTIYIKKDKVILLLNKKEKLEGEGKSVSEAMENIQKKTNERLYFGHVDLVIIDEDLAKNGIFKLTDHILRNPESKNQFLILTSKNLKKLNLANQIKENNQAKYYPDFISDALKYGKDPYTSSINKDELGNMALYKKDKFIGYASKKDSNLINLIDNKKEFDYPFYYKGNAKYKTNNIKVKYYIKNKNITISIKTKGFTAEINNKSKDQKEIRKIEKRINKSLKKDINSLIYHMKYTYKVDPLGLENLYYQKYKKKVSLLDLNIKIKTDNKIISTGSLGRSLYVK